jgi:hypothetical protein
MIRAAVFAIVLSMSGPHAVGVVCGLWCEHHAGTAAQHAGCEGKQSDSSGARLDGVHACDHLTALTPFVLQASPGKPTLQGVTAPVLPVFSFVSARASDLTAARPPPGGGRTDRYSRIDILRI